MYYKSKLFFVASTVIVLLASCGMGSQVDQLRALQKCTFSIESADSVYIANTSMSKLVTRKGFDISGAPAVVFAMLQQRLPFKARILLSIRNPGAEPAGINEFEYKVMLKDVELAKGSYEKKISIEARGGSTQVPFKIDKELYPILSNPEYQRAVANFFSGDSVKTTTITLKIKPSFNVGNEKVDYPGYISIDKEISNKQLLSFIGR